MKGAPILLVEADPFYAWILASKFEQEHLDVVVSETVSSAKKILARHLPSAVVLDVGMEEGGGFEFLADVRGTYAKEILPVCVLTELGDREAIQKGLMLGANAYLLKGHFVPIEVVRKVKQVVSLARR